MTEKCDSLIRDVIRDVHPQRHIYNLLIEKANPQISFENDLRLFN